MANSFKELAEEAEEQFPHAPAEVEQQLMGSMRVTHFVGNVVELYLPRLVDMLFSLFTPVERLRDIDPGLKGDSGDAPTGRSTTDE